MKYLISLIVILLFSVTPTFGDHLVWDAVVPDQCVDGYNVYYNGVVVNVGKVTTYNIDLLPLDPCTLYTFEVTAFNAAGESDKSNDIQYVKVYNPPPIPGNVRVEYDSN